MEWEFLTEVEMSCGKYPIYHGSFCGKKFVKEVQAYNAIYNKHKCTELEILDSKTADIIIFDINSCNNYDNINFTIDEQFADTMLIECDSRYNQSSFEIPWRFMSDKINNNDTIGINFAEYIYQKYVRRPLDEHAKQQTIKSTENININPEALEQLIDNAPKVDIKINAEKAGSAIKEVSNRLKKLTETVNITSNNLNNATITTNTYNTTSTGTANYYTTTTGTSLPYTIGIDWGGGTDYTNTNKVVINEKGIHVGGWNIGDYINNANPINDNIDKKEDKKMNNIVNFDFGAVHGDNVHVSMYGVAIRNKDGRWVSYDAKNHDMIDVEILNFQGANFLYKMPVAVSEVKPGDVIVHAKVPMFVTKINYTGAGDEHDKVTSFVAIDPYAGEEKTILPTKNMFNFNFVTKIVSLMDGFGGFKASEDNPFGNMLPFMMFASDGNDIDPMMFMMMSQNGMLDQNMWIWLALMDKNGTSKDNMLPMLLMMNMNKN